MLTRLIPWLMTVVVVALVAAVPIVRYRADYAYSKRLRIVVPGKVYRSGQMTAEGFRDAIERLGIKTVVNLQNDNPDPNLSERWLSLHRIRESELCREMGVQYVLVSPDLLPRDRIPAERPEAVEDILKVFDDSSNYPILLHCKAGLHRTGFMTAIYRMEYENWSPEQAVEEMKDHGFGDKACTASNDYVKQYVLAYRRGIRRPAR